MDSERPRTGVDKADIAVTQAPAEPYFAGWASEEGFHGSRWMGGELQRRFVERLFTRVPYPSRITMMARRSG